MQGWWYRGREVVKQDSVGKSQWREHGCTQFRSASCIFPVPSRFVSGYDVLLSGLPSGLMSPRRTLDSCWSLSTNVINRFRLILPAGKTRTLTRAGAMGDKGSAAMRTFGRHLEYRSCYYAKGGPAGAYGASTPINYSRRHCSLDLAVDYF